MSTAAFPSTPLRSKAARWMWTAVVLSLLLHVGLAAWLQYLRLQQVALPYQQEKNPRPFQVKRIEMNPAALRSTPVKSPDHVPTSVLPAPPPRFNPEGKPLQKAIQSNAPNLILPSPPEVPLAQSPALAPSAAAENSPYLNSEKAKISAEVAKFQVGPTSLGAPEFGDESKTGDSNGNQPDPGPGGTTTGTGLPAGSGTVPSFESLSPGFRTPDPGVNTNLPEPVILRLPGDILFDFDSAKLKPQAAPLMEETAKIIRQYPIANIRIEGHTDTIGTDGYNQKLSEARAREVESFLRTSLAGGNYKIESRGYGKSRPLVNPQGTIEGQQRNRRVEVVIQALKP